MGSGKVEGGRCYGNEGKGGFHGSGSGSRSISRRLNAACERNITITI